MKYFRTGLHLASTRPEEFIFLCPTLVGSEFLTADWVPVFPPSWHYGWNILPSAKTSKLMHEVQVLLLLFSSSSLLQMEYSCPETRHFSKICCLNIHLMRLSVCIVWSYTRLWWDWTAVVKWWVINEIYPAFNWIFVFSILWKTKRSKCKLFPFYVV